MIVLAVLAGCGGGGDKGGGQGTTAARKQTTTPEHQGEPGAGGEGDEEDQHGLEAIPTEDRRAFLQIGVAISRLETGAAVLTVKGLGRPRDRTVLERLLPQVRALHPRDAGLLKLRSMTVKALRRAIRARSRATISPPTGRRLLAEANNLLAAFKRYGRSTPALGALVPD
jgi:hypothetical protein